MSSTNGAINDGRPTLETKEVAQLAGCKTSNIRSLVIRDRIPRPVGKVGQSWVFDEAQIRAWVPGRPGRGRPAPIRGAK